MTDTTMSRKDALIAITQFVERLRPHTVPVHLIDKEDGLLGVVIAPESGVLVGKLVVRSEVLDESVGEAGFSDAGRADDEDDNGFEVAGFGDEPGVGAERLVVTDPLAEEFICDLELRSTLSEPFSDGGEVRALPLVLGLTT